MTAQVNDLPLGWWADNLEELDREIARLATLCQIPILQPGVIQRVLQKDASVCGTDNAIAFAKLHNLLMMHLAVRSKSVAVFGQATTAQVEDYIINRLNERFPHLRGD